MAISICLFSPTSEIPEEFKTWGILARLSAKPRNYSSPRRWQSFDTKHFILSKFQKNENNNISNICG